MICTLVGGIPANPTPAERGGVLSLVHDLRTLLRLAQGCKALPSAVIMDSRTLQSTSENGGHAGDEGAERKKGSKTHMAVDTLGDLLALLVTSSNEQDYDQVQQLTQQVQEVTGDSMLFSTQCGVYRDEQPDSYEGEVKMHAPTKSAG